MLIDPIFNPRATKSPMIWEIDICGSACEVLCVDDCLITDSTVAWKKGHAAMRISYIKDGYHRITIATISGPKDNVILSAEYIEAIKPKLLAAMWGKPFEPLTVVR